jgi:hypothetical protein
MVSKEIIKEFQQIAKEDYGRDISDGEASEIMNGLVGYFDLLAELHHEDQLDGPNLSQEQR